MMRKFSKILALVLAFAMVLCPVLTASAETTETANSNVSLTMSEVVDGAATVTVRVESDVAFNAVDFKLNFAKGITYADEVALVFDEEESGDEVDIWSVQESYVDGILSVLSIDDASMACSTNLLVFDIAVNVENASDYELYLTKIFAVGAGSADTDEVIAVFPCADNAQSGAIDVEAARNDCPDYFIGVVCAHTNTTTNETPATCTEDGSSVVTCDACGTVVSSTPLPATGHDFNVEGVIIAATEEAVGYFGYDIACTVCDALNPAYYAEDGSVRTDVDFAALAADNLVEEIPMLEKPCDTATEYSKDETGHWFDCTCGEKHDFAAHTAGDAKEENRVEAAPGVAGSYDTVVYCSVCNYEISRTSNTIPALPVGPVLDDDLEFRDVVVTVTNTVNIRYRLYKNTTKGINGYKTLGYDHVEVVVSGKEYSFETANLYNEVDIPETLVNMTADNNTGNTFLYEGISMCSLGLNINAYIKAYDAEGNCVAYSPLKESSPELLIKETLAITTTDNGKTAFTELLNMAAAAQVQFAANKAGTDLAQAVADKKLVNKGLDDTYTIKELPELNNANSVTTVEGYESFISSHKVSVSVALTQSPNIKVFVGGKDTLDISKLKVVFSYYDPDPSVKKTVEKVVDGSTAEGAAAVGVSGKRYTVEVPGFEFHNSNQTVTATVYYDVDGDGILEAVSVAEFSIETYVGTTLANASSTQVAKDMATAIAKFGLAFRNNKGITA